MTVSRGPLPETAAILELRRAVRGWLAERGADEVAVALSGGADSLALCVAAVAEAGAVRAIVVDHRLQPGSDEVAEAAAGAARTLGVADAVVVAVDARSGTGGPEAAARAARYRALDEHRGNAPVLLAHTLDDQAETMLLGLARGSGGRSIQGMRAWDAPWGRPLLGVRRATTRAACTDLGLSPHEDPHNSDPAFTRVRVRRDVLPVLEAALGTHVPIALARTAAQLQDDGDALDAVAAATADRVLGHEDLDATLLAPEPAAIRRRVLRTWLVREGATAPTDTQLRAVDALVADWRGQGPVAVGGGRPDARLVVIRRRGKLMIGQDDRRRV
ncbi:tRNA lysidine(34) synthetase TilS [Rhodococcus rhodnii]|uniref:tRNA(Ile)-lysidine synthase n=2 Tax=Rhodococcus rhodnii TaxID=38312 RepID=R7WSK0_9NOCA|nr:tRNA lysidine(34) synthetase TilS [Rhodococcus rhodnii]EOM78276.1 cell cycle protein [Rhodococcus rhodnii LMG 5362]TXG92318.1 tRNA lysidine(34) synthetase TilS [Rhodococcus rhodnii]